MAKTDTDLKAALAQAQRSEMQFAFLQKGNESVLLLAKRVSPKEVKEAKDEVKPTAIIRGKCFGENGQLVFAVKKAAAGLDVHLKKTLMKEAGYSKPFEIRENVDMDEEGEVPVAPPLPGLDGAPPLDGEGSTPPATPTQPPPKAPPIEDLQFKQRLGKLMPKYNKAVQAKTANLGNLEMAMKMAAAAARSKDYEQANVQLDKLEEELGKVLPGVETAAKDAAKLKSSVFLRLSALAKDYKEAVALEGPDVPEIQSLFQNIKDAADEKNYEDASKGLDDLEPLLKKALQFRDEVRTAGEAPATSKTGVLRRLSALTANYKTAIAARGPDVSRMQMLFTAIKGLTDNEDFEQASKVLDELEPLVKKAAGSSGGAGKVEKEEEKEKPAAGIVVFQQSRLVWDAARKKVQTELQALEKAILDECKKIAEDPESEDDIDLGELAGKTKELYKILDNLDTRLIDKLDEALNAADPAERRVKQKEAGKIVKEYQDFVNGDPIMALIDENGFTPSKVKAGVLAALNGMAGKL